MVTERQPYQVVQRFRDFEVREYPASTIVEVTVQGSFENAGNRAFGSLFGYISGRNNGNQSIAMTAPVLQGSAHDGSHAVAFVLPADMAADQVPVPNDDALVVRPMAPTTTAAVSFSGRWTEGSYDRHRAALLDAVGREGFVPVGEPRFARYNAPFTPWFLRRNEVLVDVGDPVER